MEPMVIFGIWASVVTASIVGTTVYGRRQRRRFCEAFDGDPDYEVADAATCLLRSRAAGFKAPLTATLQPSVEGSGKSKVTLWEVTIEGVALGAKTTLTLSLEGVFGALREAIGRKDVHVGDEAFDKRFTIRGSEPEVIKAVLRQHDVKKAVAALFDGASLFRPLSLDDSGQLTVHASRRGMAPDDAREVLRLVRGLAEALHRAAARGR